MKVQTSNKYRDLIFIQLLKNAKLNEPEKEFKFNAKRRWRFDFAYPGLKIAIEIEGGIYSKGRHIRGKGFENDCEKYNTATSDGWHILRIPSHRLHEQETIELIKKTYDNKIVSLKSPNG